MVFDLLKHLDELTLFFDVNVVAMNHDSIKIACHFSLYSYGPVGHPIKNFCVYILGQKTWSNNKSWRNALQ